MELNLTNKALVVASVALGLLALSGCAQGSILTAGAGPQFDQNGTAGGTVFVEASWTFHERAPEPPDSSTPMPARERESKNQMGVALVGGAASGWVDDPVAAGFVAFDYLPFLYEGAFVNFGGGVGFGLAGGEARVVGVAPRLGFGVTPWGDADARWGLGGRLNMQFTGDGVYAGPAVTISRVQLGKQDGRRST